MFDSGNEGNNENVPLLIDHLSPTTEYDSTEPRREEVYMDQGREESAHLHEEICVEPTQPATNAPNSVVQTGPSVTCRVCSTTIIIGEKVDYYLIFL